MRKILGTILIVSSICGQTRATTTVGRDIIIIGEEIVIIASRLAKTETPIKNYPGNVSIITEEVIEKLKPRNTDELLRYIPGIDVYRRTGFVSGVSNVSIRGMGGGIRGRTLVLVDGVPLNEIYGQEVYWNSISPSEIEKIEIISGAGSSLYGSGAMGGVVNIITKKPHLKKVVSSFDYGNYNTRNFRVTCSEKIKKFGFLINEDVFTTDGYKAVLPEDEQPYDISRSKENNEIERINQ